MLPPRYVYHQEDTGDLSALRATTIIHSANDYYDESRFHAALSDAVKTAHTINSKLIIIHPPSAYFSGRENIRRGIALIQKLQQDTELIIAYEVLGISSPKTPDSYLHGLKQQGYKTPQKWVDDVKHYNLAAVLDTSHVASWGINPTTFLSLLGSNVRHIHLSDFDPNTKTTHLLPGTGNINLPDFFHTLQKDYQDITVTIEVNPVKTMAEGVEIADKCFTFLKKYQ